ncbi:cysteine hydrolase family protein [Phaeacidiphilus oryzae]|uniref:cysteine hydrolase family protein n=1 Tax=Phaeacidiphilus oryzae TaxID=348818 RepID=UPI000A5C0FB5|nr:isochorismatase family cysteine hydrolase [Phaeacidiphilus oryzae]
MQQRAHPSGAPVRMPATPSEVCDPERLALIVYDMQNGVVRQLPDGKAITDRVRSIVDAAREAGLPIVFTRHMSLPVRLMGASQLRTAMAWQRVDDPGLVVSPFLPGSEPFELVPELAPRADEAVLDKITMSAFEGTPLDLVLRDLGITSFAIVGIATEIGIEPTVRQGLDLGYLPVLVSDACGHGDAEAARRSLDQLDFFGGTLRTDTEAFLGALVDCRRGLTPPSAPPA